MRRVNQPVTQQAPSVFEVDITMKAAKENEAVTADQHARESIRIARTTRELLKKFAAAHLGSVVWGISMVTSPRVTFAGVSML